MQSAHADPRFTDDKHFLRDCRWEAFRGSGPGGQKRNKTSSAVRIVHIPTRIEAVSSESRSQARNREFALRRLRHRVILEQRRPVDLTGFHFPAWWSAWGGLGVPRPRVEYLAVLGLVLDVLAATGWRVSDAARLLRVSTGALSKFLAADRKAWATVNAARMAAGLGALVG
jgi:hypothetical protein